MYSQKILIIGCNIDKTFIHTRERLLHSDTDFDEIILDDFYKSSNFCFDFNKVSLTISGQTFKFDTYKSIYHRLIWDASIFPGDDITNFRKYTCLISIFSRLSISSSCLVVNIPSFSDPNSSKIFQLIELSDTISVPQSLCTSSPNLVRQFQDKLRSTVYKSCSSVRSIVERFGVGDDLSNLSACPCLFQQEIQGFDVRVHVINDSFFCEKIVSERVDYRYGKENVHSSVDISENLKQRIRKYMVKNRLYFVGADFKVYESDWLLLEINTMPGYSGYDERCDFMISKRLISLLVNKE